MGKNQAYKAMQRAKVGSSSDAPDEIEDGMEEELKKGELEAGTDKLMREYRTQLDAERALKLSKGKNYSSHKSRKDRKERDLTHRKDRDLKKKRKHLRRRSSDSSSSSSSSDSSSSDEEESRRSRSSSKRSKRERKHTSRSRHSRLSKDEADGPVPLSEFFGSRKS